MRYRELFWDFDGTLVNTYPGMVEAFATALSQLGVNAFELDQLAIYQAMRQHSLRTALQRFSAEYGLNQATLRERYQRLAAPKLGQAVAFDGAVELLKTVTAAGGRNFLVTHRDARALDRLAELGLKAEFSGAITASDHYPRKPDPTGLKALVTQYQVNLQSALMIGDRNLDVQAGHRAGMAGALFDPEHMIVAESQPECRVTRLSDLQAWLQA